MVREIMTNTINKMATREVLEELHSQIAQAIIQKIKSGEATAADLAVARQFLKDNGVDNIAKQPGTPLGNLAAVLPFPSPAEVAEEENRIHYAH
jgi:hypothetical protein